MENAKRSLTHVSNILKTRCFLLDVTFQYSYRKANASFYPLTSPYFIPKWPFNKHLDNNLLWTFVYHKSFWEYNNTFIVINCLCNLNECCNEVKMEIICLYEGCPNIMWQDWLKAKWNRYEFDILICYNPI
jgi:hypothetical protein